jgi:cytochrome oxidase Cu insertion factor (SCO1/SenC/PrrC family)
LRSGFITALGLAAGRRYEPGDLIDPAIPLPRASLRDADGNALPANLLTGKWTMLYVGDGACDERCRKALYLSRQSRIALNKDMTRIQRVFLVTANCCAAKFLATEHPDLTVAVLGHDDASQALLGTLPKIGGVPPASAGRLYLIDPLGNAMLSYSAAAPDKALLEDLEKLLRLSHIG